MTGTGEVLGYAVCVGCGSPVVVEIARVTGSRCPQCFVSHEMRQAFSVRTPDEATIDLPRPSRRQRKGKRTKGEKRRKHQLDRIKAKAMKRLRDLHQEEYARLLAAERLKAGLEPLPIQVVLTPGPSTPGRSTMPPESTHEPEDLHTEDTRPER